MIETPILFNIYNRPDVTNNVFCKIRKFKPKHLYIAADGPKNETDFLLCKQTRSIINVDWNCNVHLLYRKENLGCKISISEAISWIFESQNSAIILEDDTLPNDSFFNFCEKMLLKYEDEKKVMSITGVNWLLGRSFCKDSYYFTRYPGIWGWATWKDRWDTYDDQIKDFDAKFKNINRRREFFSEKEYQFHFNNIKSVIENKIDSWGFLWHYAHFVNNGYCIMPNRNLISNIGFDERAVHTKNKLSWKANQPNNKQLKYPLRHPIDIKRNKKADKFVSRRNFFNRFGIMDRVLDKLYYFMNK